MSHPNAVLAVKIDRTLAGLHVGNRRMRKACRKFSRGRTSWRKAFWYAEQSGQRWHNRYLRPWPCPPPLTSRAG
jgi:hypothetical protein